MDETVNKAILIGFLIHDIKIRSNLNDHPSEFSLIITTRQRCTDDEGSNQEEEIYHCVTARANLVDQAKFMGLRKGALVYIEGKMHNSVTDRNNHDQIGNIIADELTVLDPGIEEAITKSKLAPSIENQNVSPIIDDSLVSTDQISSTTRWDFVWQLFLIIGLTLTVFLLSLFLLYITLLPENITGRCLSVAGLANYIIILFLLTQESIVLTGKKKFKEEKLGFPPSLFVSAVYAPLSLIPVFIIYSIFSYILSFFGISGEIYLEEFGGIYFIIINAIVMALYLWDSLYRIK